MITATPNATPAAQPQMPPAAPQPGTAEYDAAMVAKFESHQPATPTTSAPNTQPAQRPEHVPEKFWNAEKGEVNYDALLKSYVELERARSQPAPAAPPQEPAAPAVVTDAKAKADAAKTAYDAAVAKAAANPQDTAAATEVAAAKAALDSAESAFKTAAEAAEKAANAEPLDFNALEDEFAEKGELSPESYAKLEKHGYSKQQVDQYIEGRLAVAEKMVAEVHSMFGGEAEFAKVREWAKTNVSEADREAISRALVEGTQSEMRLAAEALKSRYEAANGKAPALETGGNVTIPASTGFASRNEMVQAMKDPRYQKDESYRAWVEARAAASTTF